MIRLIVALLVLAPSLAWAQFNPYPGPGRLFSAALDTTPPAVPTGLGATVGDTQITLNWSHSNTSDVHEYVVQYRCPSGSGGYSESTPRPTPGTSLSKVVTGLTNGIQCDFRVAAEDLANNQSAFTTAIQSTPTGGSAIVGVSKACSDSGLYGSGGNCIGSEPMNVAASSITDGFDWSDSPDTHELWGNRSGVQPFGTDGDNQMVDVSSSPGWGNQSYAYEVDDASTNWARFPVSKITSATRTVCMQYYMEVDSTYAGAGSNGGPCPGLNNNWRNKFFQWNYAGVCSGGPNAGQVCTSQSFCVPALEGSCGVHLYQAEEQSDSSCPTAGTHRPVDFYSDNGRFPVQNAGTSGRLSDCNVGPCEFQLCLDGNIQAGTNITARMRMISTETGLTYTSSDTTPINYPGGIAANDFNGGDMWHSGNLGGTERSRRGQVNMFAWDVDADNWIPESCEIAGGC